MNRIDEILCDLRLDGRGLEFGPSHNPVAPKSAGFCVETVDHLSREGLVEKYRDHGVDLSRIETVDHVWTGQPLTELISDHGQYDWVIASHVIEHVPNFIGFINQCATLLKPEGVLSLAVPNLRYSFDCMRWPTTTGELIQANLDQCYRHAPGKVFDYYTTAVKRDGKTVWSDPGPGGYELVHTFDDAAQLMREAIETDQYHDFHTWVFTPTSFRLAVAELRRLGILDLGEQRFIDKGRAEFYVKLTRDASVRVIDRIEQIKRIRAEIRQEWTGRALGMPRRLMAWALRH